MRSLLNILEAQSTLAALTNAYNKKVAKGYRGDTKAQDKAIKQMIKDDDAAERKAAKKSGVAKEPEPEEGTDEFYQWLKRVFRSSDVSSETKLTLGKGDLGPVVILTYKGENGDMSKFNHANATSFDLDLKFDNFDRAGERIVYLLKEATIHASDWRYAPEV